MFSNELVKQAKEGNAVAQNDLGWYYEEGESVERDYEKAVGLYKQAADQGYAAAQFNLGFYYEEGKSVERDYENPTE